MIYLCLSSDFIVPISSNQSTQRNQNTQNFQNGNGDNGFNNQNNFQQQSNLYPNNYFQPLNNQNNEQNSQPEIPLVRKNYFSDAKNEMKKWNISEDIVFSILLMILLFLNIFFFYIAVVGFDQGIHNKCFTCSADNPSPNGISAILIGISFLFLFLISLHLTLSLISGFKNVDRTENSSLGKSLKSFWHYLIFHKS